MKLKEAQPYAVWLVLIAAIALGGDALYSANAVENLALANEKDIFYEREMRIIGAEVLEENLGELKADVREFKREMKKDTGDIKALLNQLLLRGTGTNSTASVPVQ